MHKVTAHDWSTECDELALLRLEGYLDEIDELLESASPAPAKLAELRIIVSDMAVEMYGLGRGSRSDQTSRN